jgi:hypothetical protein
MAFNVGDTIQHTGADPQHPAKANGGFGIIMYVNHAGNTVWMKHSPTGAIYMCPASDITAASGKMGPLPFPTTFPFAPQY